MESPGTAPGSDPRITSAFMFIVPRDNWNIGAPRHDLKGFKGDVGVTLPKLVFRSVPEKAPRQYNHNLFTVFHQNAQIRN